VLGAKPSETVRSGEDLKLLPLDDAKLLEEAKPIAPDGRFRLDPAKLSARHDGQVRAALKEGVFALVILGGAHDLTDSVRRYAGGQYQYLRVRSLTTSLVSVRSLARRTEPPPTYGST
jgi:hypothetical protein